MRSAGHITRSFLLVLCIALLLPAWTIKALPCRPQPLTVYIFLSESCPICQSYTLTLKDLYKKYKDRSVNFIGLFPNYYADADSIAAFKKTYSIPFPLAVDSSAVLAKKLQATITPEVFVVNDRQEILYSGRIDDLFYKVGKRRTMVGSHDLDQALSSLISGQPPKTARTPAVGCIITTEGK